MKNEWRIRHEARRREIDRKTLAQAEAQIAAEEHAAAANPLPPVDRDEARKRIALAFGRP